jgi:hypothetical protein
MSSVTKAQICNLALAHINQTQASIVNLDTDTGLTAVQCRIHYDVARRFVLADHYWNFAKKRVTLAVSSLAAPTNWLYRYDYPSDCLHFRNIQRDTRQEVPLPFDIEDDGTDSGLCIVTDKYQAVGVYTRDVENVALFSPGFIISLGWYLASELAPALTGNMKAQEASLTVYRSTYNAAQATNSSEITSDNELESPWERARQS